MVYPCHHLHNIFPMTNLQLLARMNESSIIENCAMLYEKMYIKSHAKAGKIIDIDRFIYKIIDCMFEKNLAQIIDANLNDEMHMMCVDILAYECAVQLLNERATEMIHKMKKKCGQIK